MSPASEESNRLQAAVFCVELQKQVKEAEDRAEALRTTLNRQVAGKVAPDRLRRTQVALRDVVSERREMVRMLDRMGHSYPCSHLRAASL